MPPGDAIAGLNNAYDHQPCYVRNKKPPWAAFTQEGLHVPQFVSRNPRVAVGSPLPRVHLSSPPPREMRLVLGLYH